MTAFSNYRREVGDWVACFESREGFFLYNTSKIFSQFGSQMDLSKGTDDTLKSSSFVKKTFIGNISYQIVYQSINSKLIF